MILIRKLEIKKTHWLPTFTKNVIKIHNISLLLEVLKRKKRQFLTVVEGTLE